MSRTYPRPSWEDERHAREASKRASALVAVGAVPPSAFCLNKQAYPSRNDARHAAKVIRMTDGKILHPYKCPRCQTFYHLATTEL
jgi:hypothetical protein